MLQKVYLVRPVSNITVTFNNFDIIRDAAFMTGCIVVDNATIKQAMGGDKSDIYVVTSMDDVVKLRLRGRKQILYWVQGIVPEESYMRHHSKLRYIILSLQEKLALRFSMINLYVSNAMRDHYILKYKVKTSNSYIFPCFNAKISKPSFFTDTCKYSNNTFVYAGGLAVWQCFDQMLAIYKQIEDFGIPNTKLLVLTKDRDLAENKIAKCKIKNYELNFVTPEELPIILSSAKFGFVIREDDPVNRVSTPTKISSYLSCGLIPIFGSSILSFYEKAKTMKYVVPWDNSADSYNKVRALMESKIDANEVFDEYNKLFEDYFSNDYHKRNIYEILNKMQIK